MDTYQFTQALRYEKVHQRSENGDFQKHANGLRLKFGGLDVKAAHTERPEFVNYVDLIRTEQGFEEALTELNRYKDRGLLPALFALSILQITRRSGDFGRSEDLLRDAAEEFPRDDYVLQQYLQSTLANGNLRGLFIALDQVVLRDLSRMNPVNRCRYAELAASAGSWAHVAELVSGLTAADPGREAVALLQARVDVAAEYRAGETGNFAAHVINLVEDRRKFELVSSLFARMGVAAMRHDAVNGRALSNYVVDGALAPNVSRTDFGQGAVACALSHVAVWEKVVEGANAHALVLEDDAAPYSWRDISDLVSSAGDFDILYVNERMSSIHSGTVDFGTSHIWKVLEGWPQGRQGWGLDGYILSRRGAAKLLDAVNHDKIIGHIDGQVGAYALEKDLTPISHAQRVGVSLRGSLKSEVVLSAAALNFPLTTQLNFGYSSIRTISRDA